MDAEVALPLRSLAKLSTDKISSHFFVHSHSSSLHFLVKLHTSSPHFVVTDFPINRNFPSKSLNIQSNHWPQPFQQYVIEHLAISPSKQNEQPGTLLKVLPSGRISFTTDLQECPRKVLKYFQLSSFRWCLNVMHPKKCKKLYICTI